MNRVYRTIWSVARNDFVVASEFARSKSKSGRCNRGIIGAVAAASLLSAQLYAHEIDTGTLPGGATVTAGQVDITQQANTLTVHQATSRAAINWQHFSIGSDATVNFQQPDVGSAVLNRVVGNESSVINGALNANGQVFLLNANGLLFGKNAQINTAGLVASTLQLSDEDFLAGKFTFERNGAAASVINLGTLTAADEGYVALLGGQVRNEGVISAHLGSAILAAADKISLNFNGNSLVGVTLDRGSLQALVENQQAIIADGGLVVLTAKGLDEVMATVVNNTGEVRAQSLAEHDGRIFLLGGDSDRVEVAGTLDASTTQGQGGQVVMTAGHVGLFEGAKVNVSGATGGGDIHLGGGYQGGDAAIANAQATYVAAGVELKADATERGDGGKVIVWANGTTRFGGDITARGGLESTDTGGFAEVSGKGYLDFQGTVDLTGASEEFTGTLLLDPTNLTISALEETNLGGVGSVGNPFAPAAASAVSRLSVTSLQTALVSSNVVVSTVGSPNTTGEAGDITVADTFGWFNTRSLTLNAAGSIKFNEGVEVIASGGALVLKAGNNITQDATADTGRLRIAGTTSLTATTGDISLASQSNEFTGAVSASAGDEITLVNNRNLILGDINAAGAATIKTTAGSNGSIDNTGASKFTVGLGSTLLSGGRGAITLANITDGVNFSGVTTVGGDVTLTGLGAISFGNITTSAAVNTGINSGGLKITAAGNIVADDINTFGQDNVAGSGSAGGNVTITTSNGGITLDDIASYGGKGKGAVGGGGGSVDISTTAGTGTIAVGEIDTTGGANVLVAGIGFNGGNAGNIRLSAHSNKTVTFNGDITTAGGAGGGSNPTGLGGNINVTGAGIITADRTISSGATAGNITFDSTVNSDSTARNFTVVAGEGNAHFEGILGGTSALAKLTVQGKNTTIRRDITANTGIDVTSSGNNGVTTIGYSESVSPVTFNTQAGNGAMTFSGAVSILDDLTLIRGKGDIGFNYTVNGQDGIHDLTVKGTGGGSLLFNYNIGQLGDISLSTVKNLEVRGSVTAESLVYTDIGTGTVKFSPIVDGNSQTYSQSGGFVVRSAGDITLSTPVTTGTMSNGAPITVESTKGALQVQHNLNSNNAAVSLTGKSVTQSVNRGVNAGSGTILVDGGGDFISLSGALTTTNSDLFNSKVGPAILLRNATTVGVRGINAVNGTLQIGTAGGTADVTGAVSQTYQEGQGINIKTLAAHTGAQITIDSSYNNMANLGAITLNGSLTLRDESGGLNVLEDLSTTQVTIDSAYGALAIGTSDITATTGPIYLRGNGFTQAAGSVVDATNSTITMFGANPSGGAGSIDLAGTLTTKSSALDAVNIYYAYPVNLGNIVTGASGGVVLGNDNADMGAITQTKGTSIDTGNLRVISRDVVNLNQENKISTVSEVINFGGFTLNDAAGGLKLTGSISGWYGNQDGAINLSTTGGKLDLNGQTLVGRNISLTGTGVISGVTGGAIHGGSGTVLVDAGGADISLADLQINTSNNTATAVQFFNAGSDVLLGQINVGDGTLVLGGATTNNIRGNITQGNIITAANLTGNTTGTVTLDKNNVIGNLGNFTAGGAFNLVDSTLGLTVTGAVTTSPDLAPGKGYVNRPLAITAFGGPLNLTGSVEGDGISLTANNGFGVGSIVLNGNVIGHAGDVSLVAQGTTVDQVSGVISTTGALRGSVVTGANLTGKNQLGALGPFSVTGSGDFKVNDIAGGLALAGDLAINNGVTTITTAGGAFDLNDFDIASSGDMTLTGVGLQQDANSIINTTAGVLLLDAQGGDVTMAGAVTTNNTTASAVTLRDAAKVSLGSISALSGSVVLGVAGDITGVVGQTSGTALTAATLVVNTAGGVDLSAAGNRIGTLNGVLTLGDFTLLDSAGGLLLEAAVQAGKGSTPGSVTLHTSKGNQAGGTLALADFGITAVGNVTLQGQGITSSAASVINAGAGDITLIGNDGVDVTNGAINLLGTITTSSNSTGAVSIAKGTTLAFAGITTGATGTTTLGGKSGQDRLTSSVTQTGALITGTLAGNSGQVTLDHAGNQIAQLGPFTSSGAFELVDTNGGLVFSGDVATGGTTTLTTPGLLNIGLFDLTAKGSPLTLTAAGVIQDPTGGSSSIQAGTTLVEGGSGLVELTSANNDFTGVVTLRGTGKHVQVRDSNALTLTALSGQIGSNTGVSAIAGSTLVLANENLNTGTGAIYLSSEGGGLTTTGSLSTTTGQIDLHASETLTVNHAVTSAGGDILLVGGNIEHNDQDVTTAGTGAISATALGGGTGPNTGRVNMVDGTEYTTGSGQISISAASDARISRAATTGNVSVAAPSGHILDVLIAETPNITGKTLTLEAGTGIGLVNDRLDTEVETVRASDATGGIYLANKGALQLGNLDGGITTSAAGDVAISASGALTVANNLALTNGDLTLQAGGSVTRALNADPVAITTKALTVTTIADAGAQIDLSNTLNTVDSLTLKAFTSTDSPAAGKIRFSSDASFSVKNISTLADVVLTSKGIVSQTGAIVSDGLGLSGSGVFNLDNSLNQIQRFASDATGTVNLVASNTLRLGSVNPVGITTGGADMSITALGFNADGYTIDTSSTLPAGKAGALAITTTGVGADGNLSIDAVTTAGKAAAGSSGLAGGAAGNITLITHGDTLTFNGVIGAQGGLGDGAGATGAAGTLDITGPAIVFNGGAITSGEQTYTGASTLASNTTLTTSNSPVVFDGSLDGAFKLNVATGSGAVTFAQQVGKSTPLGSLDVTAGQININGGGVATSGDQTYQGPVVVGADAQLTTGGSLVVGGTLDSSATASVSDNHSVNLQVGSLSGLNFAHAVGSINRLNILCIQSAGVITQSGTAPITVAQLAIKNAGSATLNHASNDVDQLAALLAPGTQLVFRDANGVEIGTIGSADLQIVGISDGGSAGDVTLRVGGLLTQAVNAPITIGGKLTLDSSAFNAGDVTVKNISSVGTELGNSLVAGEFVLDSTGAVTQTNDANGLDNDAYLQVGGNFTLAGAGEFTPGNSLDNFVGGGSTFASGNTVRLFGVVTLSMSNGDLIASANNGTSITKATINSADLGGGITVISSDGGQSISPVANAQAIKLDGSNTIGGALSITTKGTYSVSSAVATGMLQDGALDLAAASFVVRPSDSNSTSVIAGAGRLDLSHADNQFSGAVELSALGMSAQLRAKDNLTLGAVTAQEVVIEQDGASSALTIGQQANTRINADHLLVRNTGTVTLAEGNRVGTLAAQVNGKLTFTNQQALTVGEVAGTAGINANSDVLLRTTAGNLVLNKGISASDAASINLVSAGNFINNAGANALTIGNGTGAWRIWSSNPSLDTLGGLLPDFKHFNANYGVTDLTGIDGDGVLYRYAPQLSVTLTGQAERIYNANTQVDLSQQNFEIAGAVAGDTVQLSTAANFADKNVNDSKAPKTVTTDGLKIVSAAAATDEGSMRVYGYQLDPSALTNGEITAAIGQITPATISAVTDITATPKSYDATTTVTLNTAAAGFSGIFKGDDLTVATATGVFASANASPTAQNVSISGISLGGKDQSNYVLANTTASATALINPFAVNLTGGRVYNGTTTLASSDLTLGTLVNKETLSLSGSALAVDKHVANAKQLSDLSGLTLMDGTGLVSNYTFIGGSHTVDITPAQLALTTSAVSRAYDGSLQAAGNAVATQGTQVFSGDTLSGGTFTFTNANAGLDKTVNASAVTVNDGNNGGNYQVSYVANTSSAITQAQLTVSSSDVSRTYDGTTKAQGTAVVTAGTLYSNASNGNNQDALSGGEFAFTDANVGAGNKTLTVAGVTVNDGNTGNNYKVTFADNTTSTISPYAVNLSGSRVYNGSWNVAADIFTFGALVGNETLTLSGTGSVANRNVTSTEAVNVSGLTLLNGSNGGLANNYSFNGGVQTVAITPAPLDVKVLVNNRVYDGTKLAIINDFVLTGLAPSETLKVSQDLGGTSVFADKNAGIDKTVTITGITLSDDTGLSGGLTSNYSFDTSLLSATASISPKAISVAGLVAFDKIYDGSTKAQVNANQAQLVGLVGDDAVAINTLTAVFEDKNAGINKRVVGGELALQGADAANYNLLLPSDLRATIAPRALALTATGQDKIYDGTTAAHVTVNDNRVSGDLFNLSYSANFLDPNAGNNKFIDIAAITLVGTDAQNYVTSSAIGAFANIAQRAINVSANEGAGKVYDGTAELPGNLLTVTNQVEGDSLNLGGAVLDSANAGQRGLNLAAITLDNRNYTIVGGTVAGSVLITPKVLTVAGSSAAGKTYDGTTSALINLGNLSGLIDKQTLGLAATGVFDSADAGNRIATAHYTLADGSNGGQAGNYVLADTTHNAVIDAKTLTITGTSAAPKTYDGTLVASINLGTLNGLVGNQTLGLGAEGLFDNANAGSRTATAHYSLSDGNNGGKMGNYVLADTTHSALINPKALAITGSTAADKTYDGTLAAFINAGTLSGLIGNQTLGLSAEGLFDSANAGSRTAVARYILANGTNGGEAGNYVLADTTHNAVIGVKTLTITGSTADGKAYDGTKVGVIKLGTLNGVVNGQTLGLSAVGLFDSVNAGDRSVVANYTLADGANGGLAGNYTLANTTHIATITPKVLSVSGSSAKDKLFDGTRAADITLGQLQGVVEPETLFLSGHGLFDSAALGNRVVTISYTLADGTSGGLASNYVLPSSELIAHILSLPNLDALIGNLAQPDITIVNTTEVGGTLRPVPSLSKDTPVGNVVALTPGLAVPDTAMENLLIVSAAPGENLGAAITLSEAQAMMASADPTTSAATGDNDTGSQDQDDKRKNKREVRVPVSRNSLADIVNGGVHLPDGVEQQLFIVKK